MNPFLTTIRTQSQEQNLPELVMEAWDFDNDHFLLDANGNPAKVRKNEALKVWIYKALKTERFRYEIYRHGEYDEQSSFGVELEQFIGKNPNNEFSAATIKEFIYDGLIVSPYIKEINSIDISTMKGDKLEFTIELTSIYGNMEVSVSV